jgi:hypothetical protein
MGCDTGFIPSRWSTATRKSWAATALSLALLTVTGLCQQDAKPAATRVWTNTGGKKITAEYLGIGPEGAARR